MTLAKSRQWLGYDQYLYNFVSMPLKSGENDREPEVLARIYMKLQNGIFPSWSIVLQFIND